MDCIRVLASAKERFCFHRIDYLSRIIVNNIVDRLRIQKLIEVGLASADFKECIFAEDHILRILSAIELTKMDFGDGYVYSSGELVGIFTCQTEYLCHYAGDASIIESSYWISKGIEILKCRPDVVVEIGRAHV